jgi:hypothetical protein
LFVALVCGAAANAEHLSSPVLALSFASAKVVFVLVTIV